MINWGIIGFGRIAHKFVGSIESLPDGKVYAVASRSVMKEDAYLQAHPEVIVYTNYESLLDDPKVDAIYLALPHKFHKEWAIKALEKKKAVLCEKPAVLYSADMKEIKEVALREKTCFLEALKTKMNDGMDQLIKDVQMIGDIKTVEANFCSDALALKGTNSFLFDKEQGGALNDVAPYLIGFVLDLLKDEVVDIESHLKIVDGIDEHFNAILTFKKGTKAFIEGAVDESKERYALITGEKGKVMVPMFNRIIDYTVELDNGVKMERHCPLIGDDMTKEIAELQKCIKQGLNESPRHTMDQTIKIIEIMEKIKNSK